MSHTGNGSMSKVTQKKAQGNMKAGIFNVDQSGSVKQMVTLVQEQAVPPRENQHIVHPQEGPTHPPLG